MFTNLFDITIYASPLKKLMGIGYEAHEFIKDLNSACGSDREF
jgi:hypothetical protein